MEDLKLTNNLERLVEKQTKITNVIQVFFAFLNDCIEKRKNYGHSAYYEELRGALDHFQLSASLDNNEITVHDFIAFIESNDMKEIFSSLPVPLHEVLDIFLMNTMDSKFVKETFLQMVSGINSDNYLDAIYSQDYGLAPAYNPNYSVLHNLFYQFSYAKKTEVRVALATFLELYYSTDYGKKHIESFTNHLSQETQEKIMLSYVLKNDLVVTLTQEDLELSQQYFNEIFEKINEISLYPMFVQDSNNNFVYRFADKNSIHGSYLIFNDSKLTFSLGLTTNDNNLVDGLSLMHHSIIYKFFADSIYEYLEKVCLNNGPITYSAMKDYWENNVKNDISSKNIFITHAIVTALKKYDIFDIDSELENELMSDKVFVSNGQSFSFLKQKLSDLRLEHLVHKKNNSSGLINVDIMKSYFENRDFLDFKMNYVTTVAD